MVGVKSRVSSSLACQSETLSGFEKYMATDRPSRCDLRYTKSGAAGVSVGVLGVFLYIYSCVGGVMSSTHLCR
jgi:hypothetical protein